MYYILSILLAVISFTPNVYAQEDNNNNNNNNRPMIYTEEPGDRVLMTRVILKKLTVWINPKSGKSIYCYNCRKLKPYGCEKQISTYVDYIFDASKINNIDPWLVAAAAWHESAFNAFAISNQGAVGLLQLLSRGTWSKGLPFVRQYSYRKHCRTKLGNCQKPGVMRAVKWMRRSIEYCGSIKNGLRLYNSGKCNGPQRYARIVFSVRENLLNRAKKLQEDVT